MATRADTRAREIRELKRLFFEVAHAVHTVERAKLIIESYADELIDADVDYTSALDAALTALDALAVVKDALKTIIRNLATHANPADEHHNQQPRDTRE